MDFCEFKATLGYTTTMHKNISREWWFTPLIPVLGSHMPLIPALKGNIKQEETEVRALSAVAQPC